MRSKYTKTPLYLSLAFVLVGFSHVSLAKNEVSFEQPEKFMDFRTREVFTDYDKKRLTSDLSKNIEKVISRSLPANQSMHITFTDIDMAGNIFPGSNEIRTFNNNTDRTVLAFEYEIVDEQGNSLKKGSEKLVNLYANNNMNRAANKYRNSRFKHELVMFSRWLNKL